MQLIKAMHLFSDINFLQRRSSFVSISVKEVILLFDWLGSYPGHLTCVRRLV